MKQALKLKVGQQLSLTPQLKQALKLLQLSSIDLEQEIQLALENNPLLDRADDEINVIFKDDQHTSLIQEQIPQSVSEAADPAIEIERRDQLLAEQNLDLNWQELIEPKRRKSPHLNHSASNNELNHFVSQHETLTEHLSWQIQMTNLSDRDKLIANSIIHCLDQQGYLECDQTDICKLFPPNQNIEEDEVNAVLSLIKTMEPIGSGAKNLRERLLILLNQIDENTNGLGTAKQIISSHLDLLASHSHAMICKELNISVTELATSSKIITQLNPRIANSFLTDKQDHILPDIIVTKVKELWLAKLNPDNTSKLIINKTYADLLKTDIDKDGGDFIQQNLIQAKLFIKNLMGRYDTLLLVGQAIVDKQSAFFEYGEEQMKPMVLSDIATQLDLHESTISRATAGKYLSCSRGVFELKYFFTTFLAANDGTATSTTAIQTSIKKMIKTEQKTKPLSDSKIVKQLELQGFVVARRTVAKYRENMRIPPSNHRKVLQ